MSDEQGVTNIEIPTETYPENDSPGDARFGEAMRQAAANEPAEAEDGLDDGDDWLPAKFRRDSIEQSAKDIYRSYKLAEQKITHEGQRRAELERELEEYRAVFADAQNFGAIQGQMDQALNTADWRSEMAAAVTAAQVETRRALGLPGQEQVAADTQRETLQVAWNLAQNTVGADTWAQLAPFVNERIQADPDWMKPALQSGDAASVASALVNVAAASRQAKSIHEMKLAAQGLPGAAGRPPAQDPAQAEWEAVRRAAENSPGRYW